MIKSKNMLEVSVIIPTYNRSKLLSFTLNSLLKQNISKNNFEVIVADDGSTDDTKEMVSKYENLMNIKYTYQEDKGYRPASARNRAIQLAEGKVCLFIDSSVVLESNCISEHILFHSKCQHPAAAIGYVYGFDNTKEAEELLIKLTNPSDLATSIKRVSEYEMFRDVRECHYNKCNDQIAGLRAPWVYFWTCHLSVPTKNLLRIGLFDEKYDGRWGIEDIDLGFRLHNDGVKICVLRTAISIHYPHGKNKAEREKEGFQNLKYFHSKFNTIETNTYLENYLSCGDINEILHVADSVSTLITP